MVVNKKKHVLFLCKSLPHYRKPFFEQLKDKLDDSNVELSLVYGDGGDSDRKKQDLVHVSWGYFVPNKIIKIYGKELYWQPVTQYVKDKDLIVVEQASKLLINYYIQFLQSLGLIKLAFWGHGRNFQADKSHAIAESIKKTVSNHAHWWFVYNERSQKVIEKLGFDETRITSFENSIDTRALRVSLGKVSDEDRTVIRQKYNLKGQNICLFCGSLYEYKNLPFLFKSADLIRQQVKDFELLIVGSGPQRQYVEEMAGKHDWIRYLGPLFGREKVEVFSISRLYLMPGLVGLGILDSFALEVPLVTTDIPNHSPEISYLDNGVNGLMTHNDVFQYSNAVVSLLRDRATYEKIKLSALRAGKDYSIENMVDNVYCGILSALERT
ncbi:MAG: glycosyltransferase family 4 protein [Leptolyngbyaceae cyanobacterium]